MELLKRIFGVAVLIAVLIGATATPLVMHAQTASSSDPITDDPATKAVQENNWRRSGSARANISSLGDTPIQDLTIPILLGTDRSDLTRNFGDARSGGRRHEGLDIMAPRDTPIVSPAEAVVLSVGNGPSSGYYVYTAIAGGETLVYMHLSKPSQLQSGAKISRGDLIGYVGNTGNASGGATHLHFELRSNNTATDPYPRLTATFTSEEKIRYLRPILAKESDPAAYAKLLVANFPAEFLAIRNLQVELPQAVESALADVSASAGSANSDLRIGSSGQAVVTLQEFLILQNTGIEAGLLARAGATGNFGALTAAALKEYQRAVGINPADGIYGASTRSYIAANASANPGSVSSPVITPQPNPSPVIESGSGSLPAINLGSGARGSDVVWLQLYLIVANKGTAAGTLARAGATGYFGSITQKALAEYQATVGIQPASGYFGPITRAYIQKTL